MLLNTTPLSPVAPGMDKLGYPLWHCKTDRPWELELFCGQTVPSQAGLPKNWATIWGEKMQQQGDPLTTERNACPSAFLLQHRPPVLQPMS